MKKTALFRISLLIFLLLAADCIFADTIILKTVVAGAYRIDEETVLSGIKTVFGNRIEADRTMKRYLSRLESTGQYMSTEYFFIETEGPDPDSEYLELYLFLAESITPLARLSSLNPVLFGNFPVNGLDSGFVIDTNVQALSCFPDVSPPFLWGFTAGHRFFGEKNAMFVQGVVRLGFFPELGLEIPLLAGYVFPAELNQGQSYVQSALIVTSDFSSSPGKGFFDVEASQGMYGGWSDGPGLSIENLWKLCLRFLPSLELREEAGCFLSFIESSYLRSADDFLSAHYRAPVEDGGTGPALLLSRTIIAFPGLIPVSTPAGTLSFEPSVFFELYKDGSELSEAVMIADSTTAVGGSLTFSLGQPINLALTLSYSRPLT